MKAAPYPITPEMSFITTPQRGLAQQKEEKGRTERRQRGNGLASLSAERNKSELGKNYEMVLIVTTLESMLP